MPLHRFNHITDNRICLIRINSITNIVSTIVKHTPFGWEKRAICIGKIKILFLYRNKAVAIETLGKSRAGADSRPQSGIKTENWKVT